jgi:hypothetical protein
MHNGKVSELLPTKFHIQRQDRDKLPQLENFRPVFMRDCEYLEYGELVSLNPFYPVFHLLLPEKLTTVVQNIVIPNRTALPVLGCYDAALFPFPQTPEFGRELVLALIKQFPRYFATRNLEVEHVATADLGICYESGLKIEPNFPIFTIKSSL